MIGPSAEFRHEEHLCAQLADAERDAPDRVASLLDLIDLVRELKAELIAAHPTRLRDRSSRTRRGPWRDEAAITAAPPSRYPGRCHSDQGATKMAI